MANWSLEQLLSNLHEGVQKNLSQIRNSIGHPTTMGDVSERTWNGLLGTYLPKRYQVASAYIVDSAGGFSEQIDVVVYDQQYSPFIFKIDGVTIVPAESVYAVFETKQTINSANIKYAQKKASSVRSLYRTSLSIPHAGGAFPPKPHFRILAGILTLDSDWCSPIEKSLKKSLARSNSNSQLDIGCVASNGYFFQNLSSSDYTYRDGSKPTTAFLFKLIALLQAQGTVPMIDIEAYSKWL